VFHRQVTANEHSTKPPRLKPCHYPRSLLLHAKPHRCAGSSTLPDAVSICLPACAPDGPCSQPATAAAAAGTASLSSTTPAVGDSPVTAAPSTTCTSLYCVTMVLLPAAAAAAAAAAAQVVPGTLEFAGEGDCSMTTLSGSFIRSSSSGYGSSFILTDTSQQQQLQQLVLTGAHATSGASLPLRPSKHAAAAAGEAADGGGAGSGRLPAGLACERVAGLVLRHHIASGSCGRVYKGTYFGQTVRGGWLALIDHLRCGCGVAGWWLLACLWVKVVDCQQRHWLYDDFFAPATKQLLPHNLYTGAPPYSPKTGSPFN